MLTMRSGVDDWQTMCGWRVHVWMTCRWRTRLRMTCGWHLDNMSSASPNLQRSLTLVSSARHPHIVRMSSAHCPHVIRTSSTRRTHETSVPRLFQVKQQRAALLKIKDVPVLWWDTTQIFWLWSKFQVEGQPNNGMKFLDRLCCIWDCGLEYLLVVVVYL